MKRINMQATREPIYTRTHMTNILKITRKFNEFLRQSPRLHQLKLYIEEEES